METKIERPTYLTQVLAEVDGFDSTLFPPCSECCEHETVLLTLENSWLRKLFAYCQMNRREMEQLQLDAKFSTSDDHSDRIQTLDNRVDMCMEIFWNCVRELYSLRQGSLGLRKEWRIVHAQEHDKMKALLGGLFRV